MNRNFKKVALFMLVTMLLLSTVIGCGSTVKEGGDTSQSGTVTSSTGTESVKVEAPVKLKLLGPSRTNSFLKFEDREKYPVWQELQKMIKEANLELEYEIVPFEQYNVVIQTRMASATNLPDIVNISALEGNYNEGNTIALNLAKQGVILALNPLIDQYSNGNIKKMYTDVYPFAPKLTTASDGNMYWFSNLHIKTYQNKPAPIGITMIIRKDWLDKLSLPVPATPEEYFNTLKAFRDKDANGNGKADEILIYDPSNASQSIAQWFGLGTDITYVNTESKKIESIWYQPGVKDYFKYLNRLVKEGIIDTGFITAPWEKIQQYIAEDKVGSISDYGIQQWFEPMIKVAKAEYLPLMPIKAVDGITPLAQVEAPTLVWQKYAITKVCTNPEAAIAFFDIIYSEKYSDLTTWGIEGQNYKVENGIKITLEPGVSDEERAKILSVAGNGIYGDTVFPRVQIANLESELVALPKYKSDYQISIMSYVPSAQSFNGGFLAIPSDEQLTEKTKLINDLTTYTKELSTKLALGKSSYDDWDSYIAQMKKLGLDRLIEIDQQLYDKYNSY